MGKWKSRICMKLRIHHYVKHLTQVKMLGGIHNVINDKPLHLSVASASQRYVANVEEIKKKK